MEKGIAQGDWVSVTSPRGKIFCEAHVEDSLEPGVAWMPFHYSGGANVLTDSENLDPVCNIPGYKQVGVKVEKVDAEKAAELTAAAQSKEDAYFADEVQNIFWYEDLDDAGKKELYNLK